MPDLLGRLQTALADRYAVESEIGRGGMATVFLAEDLRHHRKVAIKVLHPELAIAVGSERFLREIEIAAGLHHPHILPLFDSGEVDGLLFYVMPYSEGESLRDRLERDEKLPVEEAVRLTHEVADALTYAHRQGLVHRDIKPGNILIVEGHAVVTDFGVALAVAVAGASRVTATGLAVGTPTYMSPEQASGQTDIDGRSDVYSLACVLCEMVSGEAPYAGSTPQQILAQKLTEPARLPQAPEGTLLHRVRKLLAKALTREPEERITSAEFAESLESIVEPEPMTFGRWLATPRGRWTAAVVTFLLVVGGVLGWQAYEGRRQVLWAHETGLTEVRGLIEGREWERAYHLAMTVESIIPEDSSLHDLWPLFSTIDSVRTDPPGAQVYRRPYGDARDTTWHLLGLSPLDSIRLPVGLSRLRIELDGYETRFFVPLPDHTWRVHSLDPIGAVPQGMVRINGFEMPDGVLDAPDSFTLNDYYLDRTEVSNRDFKRFVDEGGYTRREFWVEPFIVDGQKIPWEEGMRRLLDRTGRPGPSTWELGFYEDGKDDYPVGGISWYEALAYARFTGKSLPTIWHLFGGLPDNLWLEAVSRSNVGGLAVAPVAEYDGFGWFGTYDQYGNVREWSYNVRERGRITFGGAWTDGDYLVNYFTPHSPWDRAAENGVRLAVYRDTSGLAIASAPVEPLDPGPRRDYRQETPASDQEFETFARWFEYDASPLEATVDWADTSAHWIVQRVSFSAAYDFERMSAYVYLPRTGRRYQAVVCWPGTLVLWQDRLDVEVLGEAFDFIMKTGRAFVLPVFKGSFDRDDLVNPIEGHPESGSNRQRDLRVKWVKDLRRTLDYLESREDVDPNKIAFYGWSWGGLMLPIALAVEPRLRVGIADEGGFDGERPLPEVDPFHYLPRVEVPVLMLNGRYSTFFRFGQDPMFDLLGTPDEHKQHLILDAGHLLQNSLIAPYMLDWLDMYLGPVEAS